MDSCRVSCRPRRSCSSCPMGDSCVTASTATQPVLAPFAVLVPGTLTSPSSPAGYPIIFTHGVMNSRLFQPVWTDTQERTAAAGARLIAVDRPGYGFSTFQEERTYARWAEDVQELAEHLDVQRLAVLGFSR